MASTSTSAKPTSRFSSFKVFKFAGSSSKAPPPPPPKDANYLYSATNPSVLSFSNQSLSLDAAYASQPPTPLSPSMPPAPQPSVRSPSPAPSRATQSNGPSSSSSSTLSPDPSAAAAAAGFRKGFMKVASLGKRTFTPKSPRFPPADELAPPEPRDDESISLPWGFQHHVHVDEEYAGFPSSWSSSLAEAGFTQEEIAGFMQARRVRSPSALIPLPLSRAQSPAPSAFSALHRQRSDASLSRSERSHRFATPEPPPPLPAAASSVPRGAPRKFSNASNSTRGDPSFDRSYSEIDAAESIVAHSDTQYVYVDRANLRQSSATMMSVATIRPGGSAPAPAPAPSPSATSTFSVASGLPRNPRPVHPTQPVPIPTQTQTQASAHQQRSRVRTPPRKVFRVVNETPPGRRSPPPAYKSPSRDDLRADDHLGSRNASSEDLRSTAAPPPLTASDLSRAAPAEKQAAGEGSRADADARDEGDEGEGEEDDEVGETSKRFSRPPPRLSVLPPRLSLRQDTIDDLSSWTESLFSSIPSGLSTTATTTSGGFSLSELAGTPTSTSTSQSSVSVSAPSPSPARRRTLKDSPNRKIPIPDITLSLTPERARGANDGDDDADERSFHLSASPLYNELMGMMQDRAPVPVPAPAPASISASASGSSASSHRSSSSLSYPSYPSFGRASPSPAPGSPALSESPFMPSSPVSAAAFHAHLAAATAAARDSAHSQLAITPPRQKDRDSSMSTASGSTVTHATIVHGASVVRSVPANVVPARVGGLAQAQARAREDVSTDEEEEDEEEDVPTLPPSPALPAALRFQQQQQQQQQQRRPQRPASRASSSGSSSAGSGSNYDFSGSPRQTLSMTSGSNSLEDGGALKSPGLGAFVRTSSPLSSPSAARTSFGADARRGDRDLRDGRARARGGDEDGDSDSDVEPAARPSIVITTDVQTSKGLHSGTTAAASPAPATTATTQGPPSARAPSRSPSPSPSLAPTSTRAQRYPPWLAEALKPLAEFIDAEADPRALFADLQEIAEGESGSVYSALVVPDADPTRSTTGGGSRSRLASSPSAFPRARANERVAIKHVTLVPGGSQKLGDLRRELELLPRAARHPHVLQMEGLYVDLVEDSLWIGMELMERSLADMLGVGADDEEEDGEGREDGAAVVTITENMIARFAWDVLLALSYLQKQHIGHRDLRSDNLLVNRDGVLKIADFSSAVHAPPGTPKTSDNVGVIYWQAPEMRTGLYDPLRVDVWSLGATAWELVEREPPFSDVVDTRQIGLQLPPLSDPESHSRSFHDFLHSCCQPVSSRPDPDELLSAPFIRTACPRSAIVRLLAQCRAVEERLLHRRLSFDSQGTIS